MVLHRRDTKGVEELIQVNTKALSVLQGDMSETDFSKTLNISRTQLWRVKSGMPVGQDFVTGFKLAYPDLAFEDYFVVEMSNADTNPATQ